MMKHATAAAWWVAAMVACGTLATAPARAEPLLLVYPNSPAVFRFNPEQYELVPVDGAQPAYGIGGVMLWDKVAQRVPVEVYRAPGLTGFEPSPYGRNEFVTLDTEFKVIVDGYSPYPWSVSNLHLRFSPHPVAVVPSLIVGGVLQTTNVCEVDGFDATTPTGDGNFYGLTEVHVRWYGAATMRITAYVDKNGNGVYDGGIPAWSILALEDTVPVKLQTWGGIKALYRH